MAIYCGTVKQNDLEGGVWELHTDDGERYQLRGNSTGLRKEGQRVRIDASVDHGGFGIGMTAPYLDVRSWETTS